MRRFLSFLWTPTVVACALLVALPAVAQNPTGIIKGRVTSNNDALPGVTITVQSPAMQGTQIAISNATGDYIFRFLPPGQYAVSFSLDGFQTLEQTLKVSAAQTHQVDAEMTEALSEEIVVTSTYETLSATTQAATTVEASLVEKLPVLRTITQAVLLSAGTHDTGPNDYVSISGASSAENLWLVNGVVIQDNIRNTPHSLYIEDAVEETTTLTSGVSAEYGRFGGGVINVITKSGGNQFSGSYRLNLSNDDWVASTPETTAKEDKINQVHELTFGGYIVRDRLWFYLAGRGEDETEGRESLGGYHPYTYSNIERRYEGKLTWSMTQNHRVLGSYIEREVEESNRSSYDVLEPAALDEFRTLPYTLTAVNYTGVLTDTFFVEAQYSKKEFAFVDSGGAADIGDVIDGTVLRYGSSFGRAIANEHYFCDQCPDKERDNENVLLKGSWFLSTTNAGTHDIVFGYDSFDDIRKEDNFQSPSNHVIWMQHDAEEGLTADGTFYPMFFGNEENYEELDYWPIVFLSQGTSFTTDSLFINDTWRLNRRWTFNIGVRYDANDGQDGSGATVADDSRISPRLGATWDIKGNGNLLAHASFGRYVPSIANSIAGVGGGGSPSFFGYKYLGPAINLDENGDFDPVYTSEEALAIVFDWFESVGGVGNTDLWYTSPSLRGFNEIVENLASPYTDEITVGITKRLGTRGLVRADYVHRDYGDFYAIRTDLDTGTVTATVEVEPGVEVSEDFDLSIVVNENDITRREYDGLHVSGEYRFSDRLAVGGNWTWSRLRGNFDGENTGSGPIRATLLDYPEYRREAWNYPTGDLLQDQRHKLRGWLVWDVISSRHHNLNLSWLENFWTGSPYGAYNTSGAYVGSSYGYMENPGYIDEPSRLTYYYTGRDAFRTDDIHRTDIAVNYSFFINAFGGQIELYLQPEVLNLFGEEGAVEVNTSTSRLSTFDPFNVIPEEGVHWSKGSSFGEPTTEDHYQTPRTFRVSLGIRF